MPRVISKLELIGRGVKVPGDLPIPQAQAAPAPPQKIDTSPIAREVEKLGDTMMATLREVMVSMLRVQTATIEKLTDKPCTDDFEFCVTERDYHGRIVKITARRIGAEK